MKRVTGLALALALLGAAPAHADETITANSPNRFTSPVTTIDQGEKVTLQNLDFVSHDVTAKARGDDGRPLFASALVDPGSSGPVRGTEYLTAGTYPFVCSIHPGMEATLQVTPAGTPVPRPADTRGPKLSVAVLSTKLAKVASRGRLSVSVRSDEAADVSLAARANVGGRTLRLGQAKVEIRTPGSRKLAIRLGRKARRALRRADSAKVTVRASGRDTAGNTAKASASRKLS